jgi:hypothetical protein
MEREGKEGIKEGEEVGDLGKKRMKGRNERKGKKERKEGRRKE